MSLSREQALKLAESGWWEHTPMREVALFQLQERLLCMPFDKFHEAVQKSLGRPVYTHEFIDMKGLVRELNGEQPPPTLEEIIAKFPPNVRVVILTPGEAHGD